MGYCVDVTCTGMIIKKKNIKKALAAINAIPVKKESRIGIGGYAWVNHDGKHPDLITALANWRYDAKTQQNGDILIEYFQGEKVGDDEVLWTAIAPFIQKDAEVEYHGEDGCQWKYVFDGKTYKELTRSVEWI